MSVVFLKVKVKSLAAEAKIIRHEERRCKNIQRFGDEKERTVAWLLRGSLAGHRRGVVRKEARHSLLALGYLRGNLYRAMERTCHENPNWEEVERMVKKYGPPAHNTSFENWKKVGDKAA